MKLALFLDLAECGEGAKAICKRGISRGDLAFWVDIFANIDVLIFKHEHRSAYPFGKAST
jgi:hypothetical protein